MISPSRWLLAQRDIPAQLEAVARQLGGTGLFAREGPLAVSFVRELRFFGHGQHGRFDPKSGTTIHAGFGFDGSILETPVLLESSQKKLFKKVPKFMAPGSSTLFEGCDTGDGDLGKKFMKAIGELFFGAEKWGYVRANTVVTHWIQSTASPGSPTVVPRRSCGRTTFERCCSQVNRRSASRYFCDVFSTTSGGSAGAGGSLFQPISVKPVAHVLLVEARRLTSPAGTPTAARSATSPASAPRRSE